MVILLVAWTCATAAGPVRGEYSLSSFATDVVEYVEGTGLTRDFISGVLFNDPDCALGRPTVDTSGDGWYIPIGDPVPVVPVSPPFRAYELVTVGKGGHLILQFDHPVLDDPQNPYGIDLTVFGNAAQATGGGQGWTNGDPNLTLVGGGGIAEPGTVSVSQDGQTWYAFTDGPFADDFAATLGRVYDEDNPDKSIGQWNDWWGCPTNPTYPLDPALRWDSFGGMTVAEVAQAYDVSAGGTGFDLAWLGEPGLDWIQYVRIESPPSGGTAEVDAISDVAASVKGDANWDLMVDIEDLIAVAGNWGATDAVWTDGDFTFNGEVDIEDLTALAGNWGYDGRFGPPAGTTAPEPGGMLLLALGSLGLLRKMRVSGQPWKASAATTKSRRRRDVMFARGPMRRNWHTLSFLRRRGEAFTLVEVLVVVSVIALLAAMLLPSLGAAREMARSTKCLSNLRQMAIAAQCYAGSYEEHYPIAYYTSVGEVFTSYAWDFISSKDWSASPPRLSVRPGLLWDGEGIVDVHQCPSFEGGHNWLDDPATGYNYNTSYIGHGQGESIIEPARTTEVKAPARCALFGDGEYASGANKFMRAPWSNPGDAGFTGRYAGTQGYRHLGKTNVAFCDGHAESWAQRYTQTYVSDRAKIAPGTGFLSPDNSLYDLE